MPATTRKIERMCYAENASESTERNETMRPEGLRQSDRVSFRMPVEASWANGSGAETKQKAETMLVSRNGGVLRLKEKLFTGQELTIRRQREGDHWKTARARIVAEIDQDGDGFLYAIAILGSASGFLGHRLPYPTERYAGKRLRRACSWSAVFASGAKSCI